MKKFTKRSHLIFNFPTRTRVLEYLYQNKNKRKSDIAKDLDLIWGNAYKTFISLIDLKLIEEKDKYFRVPYSKNGTRRRRLKCVALTERGKLVAEEIIKIGKILK